MLQATAAAVAMAAATTMMRRILIGVSSWVKYYEGQQPSLPIRTPQLAAGLGDVALAQATAAAPKLDRTAWGW